MRSSKFSINLNGNIFIFWGVSCMPSMRFCSGSPLSWAALSCMMLRLAFLTETSRSSPWEIFPLGVECQQSMKCSDARFMLYMMTLFDSAVLLLLIVVVAFPSWIHWGCHCTLTNAFHRVRRLHVWPVLYPAIWAAVCHLQTQRVYDYLEWGGGGGHLSKDLMDENSLHVTMQCIATF